MAATYTRNVNQGSTAAPSGQSPSAFCLLSDVRTQPVRWLLRDRIPYGEITVVVGDPGAGKSMFSIDAAARVSAGQAMPFEVQGSTGEPGSVLLLSAEDGAGAAIRPRLETAGGDASKVMVLNELDGRPFSLPAGYDLLEQVIREKAVRLVVIDPFSALVDCNHNSDRAVRAVLSPLAGLARKYKTAIMIVCHPNKRQTRSAVQCGLGSTGIIAMARSALLLTKHPDDPEQRVLATIKSNIGKPVQALAFKIKPVGRQARIEWLDKVDLTADDLLAKPRVASPRILAEAKEFMSQVLSGGPLELAEVMRLARNEGHQSVVTRLAMDQLGITRTRTSDPKGTWYIALPSPSGPGGELGKDAA